MIPEMSELESCPFQQARRFFTDDNEEKDFNLLADDLGREDEQMIGRRSPLLNKKKTLSILDSKSSEGQRGQDMDEPMDALSDNLNVPLDQDL